MTQHFPCRKLGSMVRAPKEVLSSLATQSEADSDMISWSLVGSSAAEPHGIKDVSN